MPKLHPFEHFAPRQHAPRGLLAAALAASVLLVACRTRSPAASAPAVSVSPAPAPPPRPPLRCLAPERPLAALQARGSLPSEACLARARQLLSQMTLEEKLGQMLQPERGQVRSGDIARFGFGSILSGGGSAPPDNTPLGWARMITDFHAQSLASRLGVPLLYGVDAVHGHNNVPGAVIFPHNIGLGASRDADLVTRIGRATALEVAATGADWTFAPVVAAARDERWGRTYEAFGEAPELAEQLGPALISGLQGARLGARPDGVLACAKHYLGDGHTRGGDDQGDASIPSDVLARDVLPAYAKAIEAGVGSIMISFSSLDGVKMHCHGPLLNDTLKGELGFGGFLVSDWRGIEQLPGDAETQLAAAIGAGVDMIMAATAYTGTIAQLQRIVPERVSMERIDDAVLRILSVKCALGKLEPQAFRRDTKGALVLPADVDRVGAPDRRALAREAVQKSLVLLKNEGGVLPLSKGLRRIHVSGSHSDDIGNQCGGWTVSWQGSSGNITRGTTLRQAFEQAVGTGTRVTHSLDGSGAEGADVVVVAIGERPYAEGNGDNLRLELEPSHIEAVRRAKQANLPLVLVLMTGRPMLLGDVLPLADAVVAAWLPGTEAAGITDVLFGDEPFSGKLSHSWPRSLEQVPINVGDASYDPLFPYGFGLTYAKPAP